MKPFLFACLTCFSTILFAGEKNKITIEADKESGCLPLNVHFNGVTDNINATYKWVFGNGVVSKEKNPSAYFLHAGKYSVKLFVSNGTQTDSVTQIITAYPSPKADFVVDKTTACVNEPLDFICKATSGNAPITKYLWGFGDGKTDASASTVHSFKTEGSYNVTLIVTDANGCTADKTSYSSITVNPNPSAAFTPSVSSSCTKTQEVSFYNSSVGKALTCNWNFGDNSFAVDATPSHLFLQGKHTVTLTITDANGCSDKATKEVSVTKLETDFIASKENVCVGELVKLINMSNYKGDSWSWEFGDGTTSAVCHPEKTYTKPGVYSIKLSLTDGVCSATTTKEQYIHVADGKIPSFTSDVTSSCSTPLHVKFRNTTSNTAISLWEFGDGTISTEANPEKTFTDAGAYKISLSSTDSNGCVIKKKVDNYIQAAKPLVRFTGETFGCAGYPVRFSNLTPSATSYLWNFGDGETSTEKNPSHIYKQNGRYTVSLTARNGEICDSTITIPGFVNIDTIKVDFAIKATMSSVPPFVCLFTNETVCPNAKYVWDFGDGNTDNSTNPTHIYNVPGNFNVRLVAYSKSGCSNSKVLNHSLQIGTTSNAVVVRNNGL